MEVAIVPTIFFLFLFALFVIGHAVMISVYNELYVAAREGARLVAMDREGIVAPGQTTNEKVVQDVRIFLIVNGLPGDTATVIIADDDDRITPFDLDDDDNDLELFQIIIEVPYNDDATISMPGIDDYILSSRVVFRNGRAMISQ